MRTLAESIVESLARSLNITESKIDNIMLEIRNTHIESSDDFERACQRINKIPDTDLLKFTEEFFWMLMHEVGTDIQKDGWYKQSKEDASLGRISKGISLIPDYTKYGITMYPEGYDENGDGMATVRAIGIDTSRKVNVLVLIEHPGGKDFIHSFPLNEVIKNPGNEFKTPGAITEYITFDKRDIVDIILSVIASYFSSKENMYAKNHTSVPTQTPKPAQQSTQLYTSIQQFKKDFPKKLIYDLFKNHIDSGKIGRNRFNPDLFDDQYKELGNAWNSYVEAIRVEGPDKIYFDIYVQGDSTDSNELVSYNEFTRTSGNVTVKSTYARGNAVYDDRTRLKILNKIVELLSDAVDGNDVFV